MYTMNNHKYDHHHCILMDTLIKINTISLSFGTNNELQKY